ncbi:ABC transporter substrate-binding protein [Rhodococcoides kyotonense]|uniref:Iron complex transport system substrate-binding protein n=1 Tax=Rhodococcoides kyotonense TaxID=398843 RepID=A0A239IUU2_9NOCA|nr:ABC transporter substrate-binding protein [Rhodococcus kyotonensis]SNS97349.1 iron complex transport system substrate-binding protein [Rhodococcus kyotonensis]
MQPSKIMIVLVASVAFVAGCSSSDPEPAAPDELPQSIVSLSPTATETLFAVGAGDQVVAVDSQSDYPTDAPKTDLSAYTPSLEAIIGYEPDLVIASDDIDGLVAGLAQADIPTLLLPAATSIDDAYSQIEKIADATGHDEQGDMVVADMKKRIDDAVASVPAEPQTYFHELDSTLYTVTSTSFVGQIYGLFGLTSIADGSPGGDYPQMSDEGILAADPDIVFLADAQCCGVTPESVAARPGWSAITAVRDGKVFAMDEDLSSRWGPRVADQVEAVAAVLR